MNASTLIYPLAIALLATACAHTPQSAETDPFEQRANDIVRAASAAEPATTQRLQALAAKVGGKLIKLEYRLKTRESTLRKLKKIVHDKPETDVHTLELNDPLRYTMQIEDTPAGHHVAQIHSILATLIAEGHTLYKLKNYWPRGDNYSGVNTVLRTATGLRWELQFHTEASFETITRTRALYEELREVSTPIERKRAIFKEMAAAWETIPIPQDMLQPGSLHAQEKIVALPAP